MNLFQRIFSTSRDQQILKRISSIEGLGGMTVNERLYVSGLDDEFHEALDKDKNRARQILTWLKVDDASIKKIVASNPKSKA